MPPARRQFKWKTRSPRHGAALPAGRPTAHDHAQPAPAPDRCAFRVRGPHGRVRQPARRAAAPHPAPAAAGAAQAPAPPGSPSATGLAVLLVAVAGKGGHADLTRGYLAARLGVSGRTVARLLAQLRAFGYIATRQTVGTHGETTGLRVALPDPLMPYWEADQPPAEQGVTELAAQQGFFNNQETRRLAGGHPVLAYPR